MNAGSLNSLNSLLLNDLKSVLSRWLPNGVLKGKEWCVGSIAGEPGNSLRINLETGRWCDFANGDCKGGNPISLYAAIHNLPWAEARRVLDQELASKSSCVRHPQPTKSTQSYSDQKVLIMPDDLRKGTREEMEVVARLRRVDFWGVATMQQAGVLWFGTICGFPCWIVTDESRKVAEARRMDGHLFPAFTGGGERKAHTLKGSSKSWPVGLLLPNNLTPYYQKALLVEGSGDLVAAYHFVHKGTQDWLPIAMLGAGCRIDGDALTTLIGRSVRLIPHCDEAGSNAASQWRRCLSEAGISGTVLDLSDLRRRDGAPVKDLGDCTDLHPDDQTELEDLLK